MEAELIRPTLSLNWLPSAKCGGNRIIFESRGIPIFSPLCTYCTTQQSESVVHDYGDVHRKDRDHEWS